ncbi:hypothetical protein D8811_00975 [Streptococcus gordonii]|jgi:hypothetical protein|uniref:hypothetical protein n=1 Tax=Streptococcus gordonii TaxID=1302 RepID=UPI000F6610C7|nr:hypothetical protein [Streptococcus gordonii]RSJ59171.1 hypothetical protein D8811_00975 [Streptococcus gordonii]RSK08310.1 hypothetical protein D8806_08825 [Streptococcus gordonii]
MSFKGFLKAKTVGEFLQARKDPELMKEIENRSVKTVLENSVEVTEQNNALKKQKMLEKNAIKCPHCKSKNVSFMQQGKKAFSVGKAVGGAVLTGGIGTLAGFAGKKGKKQWHCQDCGNVFETK